MPFPNESGGYCVRYPQEIEKLKGQWCGEYKEIATKETLIAELKESMENGEEIVKECQHEWSSPVEALDYDLYFCHKCNDTKKEPH